MDEIPEEMLPEPFNRPKLDIHSNMNETHTSSFPIKTSTDALTSQQLEISETCIQGNEIPEGTEQDLNLNINNYLNMSLPIETSIEARTKQQPAVASYLSRSFCKRFSQKVISNEVEKNSQNLSKTSLPSLVLPVPESHLNKSSSKEESSSDAAPSPAKLSFEPTSNEKCLAFCASPSRLLQSCPPATPSKELDAMNNENCSSTEIASINLTPAKLASTPARLMNVTPALHPPKRCYMNPEDDSTSSQNKLLRRPPCSRSLKFDTPIKNEKFDEIDDIGGVSVDDDVFNILHENLLQSVSPIVNSLCFHPYQAWFYVLFKTIHKLSFFFF